MPTFGFSAFLKLLSLNSRPQRLEVAQRLSPSEGGYDFHRSLRLRARRLLVLDEGLQTLIDEAAAIKNAAERRSLESGLRQLDTWREKNPGQVVDVEGAVYESPSSRFKVSFVPDFGWKIGGKTIAVHVWNTSGVELSERMAYAALAMIRSAYSDAAAPDDVAVLSLPDSKLFRLGEVSDMSRLAVIVAANLEALFDSIGEQGGHPPVGKEDQPRR